MHHNFKANAWLTKWILNHQHRPAWLMLLTENLIWINATTITRLLWHHKEKWLYFQSPCTHHFGSHFSEGLSHMSCIRLDALLNRESNGQKSIWHCEEVIKHFLKLCNSLSSYFMMGWLMVSLGIGLSPKGKTLGTGLFLTNRGTYPLCR